MHLLKQICAEEYISGKIYVKLVCKRAYAVGVELLRDQSALHLCRKAKKKKKTVRLDDCGAWAPKQTCMSPLLHRSRYNSIYFLLGFVFVLKRACGNAICPPWAYGQYIWYDGGDSSREVPN